VRLWVGGVVGVVDECYLQGRADKCSCWVVSSKKHVEMGHM
jgi:hypothetical protein